MLKHDWITKLVLSLLLLATTAWQIVTLTIEIIKDTIGQFHIIAAVFVFATSLLYAIIGFIYVHRERKIIKTIMYSGQCASAVNFLFSVRKRSFIKLYSIVNVILTLLSIFVLIASITYAILSLSFLKEISYFYPVLINLCLIGLFSGRHLFTQIAIQEKLSEINNM